MFYEFSAPPAPTDVTCTDGADAGPGDGMAVLWTKPLTGLAADGSYSQTCCDQNWIRVTDVDTGDAFNVFTDYTYPWNAGANPKIITKPDAGGADGAARRRRVVVPGADGAAPAERPRRRRYATRD